MPLRSQSLFPAASLQQRHWHRLFHASVKRRAGSATHYETLQIPVDASPIEVKKSFYALSKAHHPDLNPDDPHASERFVRINEAYTVLGTPAKRQQYDREVLRTAPPSPAPQRSYSSSGPVGGRAASGLSRRKTQFRGPPPSFYRSGGWGEHSAKRTEAQQNGAPGAERPPDTESMGGMGHGQRPWGHDREVPHFDKEGHFRTHEQFVKRRRRRESGGHVSSEGQSMLGQFLWVAGLVGLTVLVPTVVFQGR